MGFISTNQFKQGVKLLIDGEPYNILENEFVKPGKGQAFNRVKLRNLKNAKVIEKTYKSGESLELADVTEIELQYLYNNGSEWVFMNTENFEQITTNSEIIGDTSKWLKPQELCQVTLWNEAPISVTPPNFVNLLVIETDPGVKGDTATGGSKPATLETGAVVKVPLFIEPNELLKIDTRTGEYISRVKE